jgi:hypothetical protein
MDTRGEKLATQFEHVSGAFVAALEPLDETDLARQCAAEQCTVAALAAHIATVYDAHVDWVPAMVTGRPLPHITMADIDRNNAKQAALNAHLGKDEVLTRVRTSRDRMLAVLRGLREGDPVRVAPFSLFDDGQVSVRTLVEQGLIAHTEEHLASLRATIGAPTTNPPGS